MTNLTLSEAQRQLFVYTKDTNTGRIKKVAVPSAFQVGLRDNPASLSLFSSLSLLARRIDVQYPTVIETSLRAYDTLALLCVTGSSGGTVTVNLPDDPEEGQVHIIKDGYGNVNTWNLLINAQTGSTIDGQQSQLLAYAYDNLGVFWAAGAWHIFASSPVPSGGGGASVSASYVTVNSEAGLTSERRLTGTGNQITIADGGAGTSVAIGLWSLTSSLTPGSYTNANITVDAYGRITVAGNGASGGASTSFFRLPILHGVGETSTALSESKKTVGACYFDPTLISNLSGSNAAYYWRAIMRSSETPVSAAIDLYDVDGIVAYPPGIITGSIMSSSNQSPTRLQADLSSLMSIVTGSGIIEARVWKTVSGSVTSSIACYSAGIEVEFSN